MDVDAALRNRISTRAFLPRPVDQALVHRALDAARWAPSGGNLQPWKVIVVTGAAQQALKDAVAAAVAVDPRSQEGDRPMYPESLWEPYRTRRYELGELMYEQLGIGRDDEEARIARLLRNFEFFGAPVGLFFVIDDRMGHGQFAHLGMFMQSLALAALELGLATCMQEAWAMRRGTLRQHFGLEEHDFVYCGMALGYADREAPVNQWRSPRVAVDAFTTWLGWDHDTSTLATQ